MSKKFKKYLSVLLATVLATGCLSAVVAFADDSVALNEMNFPDANFRAYLSENVDTDGNGALSVEERDNHPIISVTNRGITSLKGIEYFPNLKNLSCSKNPLDKLDVSTLTELTSLTCMADGLSELNLYENNKLQRLNCANNQLTSLVVLSDSLTKLDCYVNKLEKLDLTSVPNLKSLRCDQNSLKSLDLSNNQSLTSINCTYNNLTSLDLSKNTSLANVTNAMIGNQSVSLKANFDGNMIVIPFENSNLDNDNYVSSTLDDYGDGSGFNFASFIAYDVSEIDGGIEYYCNTKLAGSENMKVSVTVSRDFHQVSFYADSENTSLIGRAFANDGQSVTAPEIKNPPQCKVLDTWSDTLDNVTGDKSIYANWKDAHSYSLSSFSNDTATVKCSACGDTFTLSFINAVNSKKGDEKYSPYLDVAKDGVINAKDYALLNKMK